MRRGDLAGAVDAARRRIQLQPLEEVGYRTLMRLQADLGDRAGAVSTYHHCASVLERELGVVPDPATRQAFQRLMARFRPAGNSAPGGRDRGRPPRAARGPARRPVAGARPAPRAVAGRRGGPPRPGPGPRRRRGRQDPPGGRARRAGPAAGRGGGEQPVLRDLGTAGAGPGGGLAAQPRRPVGATATLDPAWRAEVGRLVPRRGPRAGRGDRVRGRWPTPGSATASSRAWPGRCWPSAARCCWSWTTCSGATRRRWPSSRSAWGSPRGPRSWWPGRCATTIPSRTPSSASGPPDAGHGTAHRDPPRARWTPPTRPGSPRRSPGRRLRDADADLLHATTGGFPLYVIEAVRGTADRGGTPLPVGDLAAVLRNRLEQADRGRPGGGRAGRGGGDELHPRPAHRGQRPGRRHRRGGGRRAVAAPDHARVRRRLRLLPRPAPRDRLRAGQPAEALAAAPAHRPGPRAAARRRHRRGRGAARRAVRPRRAAAAGGGLLPAGGRRRGGHVRPRRGDPAARARRCRSSRTMPAGRDRDSRELAVLEAMAAPLNARYGYSSPELQRALERSIALAESLGRKDSTLAGLVALWASQFVQGRTADSYQTATRALALVDPGSELSGPAHFAVGGSAVSLGMPAEGLRHLELAAELAGGAVSLSVGTRPDVHGTAWAAHAHWLLGHDDEALAACRDGHRAGPGDRPPVQPGRGPGLRRHHPPDAPRPARAAGHRRRAARAVRPVRLRLLPRVGADPGRLVARGRAGHRPGPAGHRQPQGGGRVRPHAVLAVAARRPAGPRRPARRGAGDPRRRARRRRRPTTTCGGCPR